jgi:RNA polymerase sigma-70 factor, ECF subfamily
MSCLPDLLWDSKKARRLLLEPAFWTWSTMSCTAWRRPCCATNGPPTPCKPPRLVNEAFLRLSAAHSLRVEDRQHFLRIAAHSMRQILIDYARGRHTQKRDGLARVDLDACQNELISSERTEDFVALDAALDRLAKMDARQAQIVELRFFAGLSVEETAENLGISEKTVKRDWSVARAWLRGAIEGSRGA